MLAALLLASALSFTEADADYAFRCASNLVTRCTPRDAGTGGGYSASDYILNEASISGANMRRRVFRAPVRVGKKTFERTFVNLACTVRGTNDNPWVVFVSHFDTKPGVACPGANDGASTSGLLVALAVALSERGYRGGANIMFLWTDGEECVESYSESDGLWGSKHAAKEFGRLGMDVRAVVCLDMLGDAKFNASIPANGSETLKKIAMLAAKRAGWQPGELTMISEHVRDDHAPFLEAGYPAIDIIDFDYGSAPGRNDWWHAKEDSLDKISRESLLKGGRLAMELIRVLSK